MGEEGGGSKGNTVVRWERFLPRMFLRVLLVEADDSTRQIIAALLRKCSYKVAAVSDGLKAWETLKEKGHFIDLVLTEVELPSVSGFCLLTMIMEHEACKNIPVIMMSSQDSVSMVFKCMLRGAADFLVKPIRRNELRNLWQHVWRRQSSNSASWQGGQDENIPVANIDAIEENNTASNQSSDNVARVQKKREQNEKENDTQNESMKLNMPLVQSSCTNQYVEVESPTMHDVQEPLNPNHPSNSQDSNENVEIGGEDMDCAIISQMPDIVKNGKVAPGTSPDQGISEICNVKLVRPSEEAIDLIGALDSQPQFSCTNRDQLCAHDGGGADHHSSEKVERSSSNSPLLELSLKRSLSNSCENDSTREKPTLNHSNVSAFSRYGNKIVKPQVLLPNGLATEMREGSSSNHLSMSSPVTPNGSATSRFQIPAPVPMRGIGYDGFGSGYSAMLQPMYYGSPGVQLWTENSGSQHEMIIERSSNQPNQGAHNLNQNHYENVQTANRPIYRPMPRPDQNQEASKDQVCVDSVTPPFGSSSLCNGTENHLDSIEVIVKTCDSSGRNNTAAKANAIDRGINNDGIFANGVVAGISYLKSTEREAALNKFRLKRKERCFEKKVRYQSRKKLAEQRPRVKGQFVRQVQSDP